MWERQEALRFLATRTGERDHEISGPVAEALGDSAACARPGRGVHELPAITLAGYLRRLQHRAPELFAAARPPGYEHTVATVWSMAFDQIEGASRRE